MHDIVNRMVCVVPLFEQSMRLPSGPPHMSFSRVDPRRKRMKRQVRGGKKKKLKKRERNKRERFKEKKRREGDEDRRKDKREDGTR